MKLLFFRINNWFKLFLIVINKVKKDAGGWITDEEKQDSYSLHHITHCITHTHIEQSCIEYKVEEN